MQYIVNKTVSLDKEEFIPISAVENDNNRYIKYTFLNGSTYIDLTGATVSIYAINSEYQEIRKDLSVIGNEYAQLELTSDLLKRGITQYQLKIQYTDGTILKTKKMQIAVSEDMERR